MFDQDPARYGLKHVFECTECHLKSKDTTERSERDMKMHVNVKHNYGGKSQAYYKVSVVPQ